MQFLLKPLGIKPHSETIESFWSKNSGPMYQFTGTETIRVTPDEISDDENLEFVLWCSHTVEEPFTTGEIRWIAAPISDFTIESSLDNAYLAELLSTLSPEGQLELFNFFANRNNFIQYKEGAFYYKNDLHKTHGMLCSYKISEKKEVVNPMVPAQYSERQIIPFPKQMGPSLADGFRKSVLHNFGAVIVKTQKSGLTLFAENYADSTMHESIYKCETQFLSVEDNTDAYLFQIEVGDLIYKLQTIGGNGRIDHYPSVDRAASFLSQNNSDNVQIWVFRLDSMTNETSIQILRKTKLSYNQRDFIIDKLIQRNALHAFEMDHLREQYRTLDDVTLLNQSSTKGISWQEIK